MGDDRGDSRGQRGTGQDYNPNATIDRVFGFADRAVSALGELAGVSKKADDVRRMRAGAVVFRLVEAADAETGAKVYIVTDGRERAECTSVAMANRVLAALNGGVA